MGVTCCPYCRSTNIRKSDKTFFMEFGKYDYARERYQIEGNVDLYQCMACGNYVADLAGLDFDDPDCVDFEDDF